MKDYKKVLEGVVNIINTTKKSDIGFTNICNYIGENCPELQESEDERTRKDIINFVKSRIAGFPECKRFVTWLEKQGKEKYLSEPIKDYQGSFACWNNAHDFRPKHLQRCICYDKYMKGVYCYVYDDISKYWCTQTTEEHDSDGDNHISDYADYRVPVWMPLPDISFYPSKSWLEKQGEQKHTIEMKSAEESLVIDSATYNKIVDEVIYGEQKPADKVEPKFKVGDWVVDENGIVRQILSYKDGIYKHTVGYSAEIFEDEWRMWTIEDAKDGDVLCYKDEISLYKHDIKNCTEQGTAFGGFVYYCCYDGKRFIIDSLYSLTEQDKIDIHPANKEQRELLFQNMNEAGYEWDAEKKELKKVVQKPAWSEEDEHTLQGVIDEIQTNKSQAPDYDLETYDRFLSWLKSLKERIGE